jgi:hypothetical protein
MTSHQSIRGERRALDETAFIDRFERVPGAARLEAAMPVSQIGYIALIETDGV